jgi:hypothetical protein
MRDRAWVVEDRERHPEPVHDEDAPSESVATECRAVVAIGPVLASFERLQSSPARLCSLVVGVCAYSSTPT